MHPLISPKKRVSEQSFSGLTLFYKITFIFLISSALGILGYSSHAYAQKNILRYSHGLIWKIEKDNMRPSYLLGTMHVADSRVTHFGDTINGLIGRCDSLTLEAKFDENAQAEMFKAMMLRNNKRLDEYISEDEMAILLSSLASQPMMAQMVVLLKPWAATLLLSMPQNSSGMAMDAKLQGRFTALNKPVYQLESPMEQINIFEQLAISDQVEMLRETIAHVDEIEDVLQETLERYLAEDIAGLLQLNNKHLAESKVKALPTFLRRLVEDRNVIMASRMQERLNEGNALIAVGALHLPGDEGLLSLLEALGYRLTNFIK